MTGRKLHLFMFKRNAAPTSFEWFPTATDCSYNLSAKLKIHRRPAEKPFGREG